MRYRVCISGFSFTFASGPRRSGENVRGDDAAVRRSGRIRGWYPANPLCSASYELRHCGRPRGTATDDAECSARGHQTVESGRIHMISKVLASRGPHAFGRVDPDRISRYLHRENTRWARSARLFFDVGADGQARWRSGFPVRRRAAPHRQRARFVSAKAGVSPPSVPRCARA